MQQQLEKTITGDGTITAPTLAVSSEFETREQIAALAYVLWQGRGCPDGTADEDWCRAEQEIAGSETIEVESQDPAERSSDAEAADASVLRFPAESEFCQAAHVGDSRWA